MGYQFEDFRKESLENGAKDSTCNNRLTLELMITGEASLEIDDYGYKSSACR